MTLHEITPQYPDYRTRRKGRCRVCDRTYGIFRLRFYLRTLNWGEMAMYMHRRNGEVCNGTYQPPIWDSITPPVPYPTRGITEENPL